MKYIAIVTLACTLLLASPLLADDTDISKTRQITVSGEAQLNVVPDEIVVSIGAMACGDTPSKAREAGQVIAQKVIALADKFSIGSRNVQTDLMEVSIVKPEYYDWQVCNDSKPKSYGARQLIRFTLKDTTKIEPLLSKALEVGANRIIGVDYRTTELRKYRDQARALAIKAAKEKAVALAGELDQRIGKPLTITEQPIYGRDWNYYGSSWWWSSGYSSNMANSVQNVTNAPGQSAQGDIALGQIGVTARVTVSFELQ